MVNTFSFCLYGPENPRYYPGLLENIYLAGMYFPDWKVYIYYAPDVDESMVRQLQACSSVVLRPTGVTGAANMIHRFYAIDEPDVDVMMVRDADSRIHWKDRWAIREFVKDTRFIAHTIRDNIVHTAYMMGGLWGMRKCGINMHELYSKFEDSKGHRLAHDQNFLADMVYPIVKERLLVHYSNKRLMEGEYGVEFPFEWSNSCYCGRIEKDFIDKHQPPLAIKPFRLQGPLPKFSFL
jgi:hypothetical protein